MSYYLKCLKNYAVFEGRARRKEYWMFVLVNLLIVSAICLEGYVFGIAGWAVACVGIYLLAVLIPGIAVTIRRLHDMGRSGWLLLVVLIPGTGVFLLLIFLCMASTLGENQYGVNPCANP